MKLVGKAVKRLENVGALSRLGPSLVSSSVLPRYPTFQISVNQAAVDEGLSFV